MDKEAFREKLLKHINEALEDDNFDDELTFSEFWGDLKDTIDRVADADDEDDVLNFDDD